MVVMTDVTRILNLIEDDDPTAAEQLLPLVYDELRRLAAARLKQESRGDSLDATALVHEAYLRLVKSDDANVGMAVRRRVALKIIKPGMDTKHVIARFEADGQAVSMMDHPNIAHLLEVGTTAAVDQLI